MDTIKIQRDTYELRTGDAILDNGSCLQMTSRPKSKGFYTTIPLVSKKAFLAFTRLPNVKCHKNGRLEKWIYE